MRARAARAVISFWCALAISPANGSHYHGLHGTSGGAYNPNHSGRFQKVNKADFSVTESHQRKQPQPGRLRPWGFSLIPMLVPIRQEPARLDKWSNRGLFRLPKERFSKGRFVFIGYLPNRWP